MPYYEAGTDGCVGSIADAHGFFWQTLWELPENAKLKALRGDPNVLAPTDKVFVPALRTKTETGATDAQHRFRRKGVPSWFRLTLRAGDGTGRANLAFTLDVDGVETKGKTDGDGNIAVPIAPGAAKATLTIDGTGEAYTFNLGHLLPADSVAGAKARLKSLGFYDGDVDDTADETFAVAVRVFQGSASVDPTGTVDDATRKALIAAYGA